MAKKIKKINKENDTVESNQVSEEIIDTKKYIAKKNLMKHYLIQNQIQ